MCELCLFLFAKVMDTVQLCQLLQHEMPDIF